MIIYEFNVLTKVYSNFERNVTINYISSVVAKELSKYHCLLKHVNW